MQLMRRGLLILGILLCCLISTAQNYDVRDKLHQPDKVMDVAGVKPGMIIGELGSGSGYFTFKLAARVGASGKIYANDISSRALTSLRRIAQQKGISNIETILGAVDDPLLPADLDMVFIVNAFHDFTEPVAMLENLYPSLKPEATVVIMDRDPAKINDRGRHLLSQAELQEIIEISPFELIRVETFPAHHNIYILRSKL